VTPALIRYFDPCVTIHAGWWAPQGWSCCCVCSRLGLQVRSSLILQLLFSS